MQKSTNEHQVSDLVNRSYKTLIMLAEDEGKCMRCTTGTMAALALINYMFQRCKHKDYVTEGDLYEATDMILNEVMDMLEQASYTKDDSSAAYRSDA